MRCGGGKSTLVHVQVHKFIYATHTRIYLVYKLLFKLFYLNIIVIIMDRSICISFSIKYICHGYRSNIISYTQTAKRTQTHSKTKTFPPLIFFETIQN